MIFVLEEKKMYHCHCSLTKSYPAFCNPMDFSTPDSSVPHCLLNQVMLTNYLIISHPLRLFSSIFHSIRVFSKFSSWHQMAKVWEIQLQHQSFQWIFRVDFLSHWLVWSLCCPRDIQEFARTPQFESIL